MKGSAWPVMALVAAAALGLVAVAAGCWLDWRRKRKEEERLRRRAKIAMKMAFGILRWPRNHRDDQ
jgi:hypothetical protein